MPILKNSYLDPLILARIGRLQVRSKIAVDGFVAGLHQSPHQGISLEFAQHREYSFGDETKYVDWKIFARSDRFFVKQFRQETNLRLYVLVDASGSMGFKGEKSAWSKYDYAATLASTISYLTLRQGDSVGLGLFREGNIKIVPPRSSFAHMDVILEELSGVRTEGETTLAENLSDLAHSFKKRSLVVVLSDLLDDDESVLKALKFLRFRKHEVVVIHADPWRSA